MSLITTTDKKSPHLPYIMDQLLSDSLFPPRRKSETKAEKQDDSDSNDDEKSDDRSSKKDPLASKVWRMYTKAKDTLPNGSRMENLTWRMMAMTLTKKKLSEEAAAKATATKKDDINDGTTTVVKNEGDAMDVDQSIAQCANPTTPPAADDTTGLLSSSAPPYTMLDFFNKESQYHQQQQQQLNHQYQHSMHQQHESRNNVMVSGSMRAIATCDHVPQFTPVKRRVYCETPSRGSNSNSIIIPSLDEEEEEDDENDNAVDPYSLDEEDFNKFSQSVPSRSYYMQPGNQHQNTALLGDTNPYNSIYSTSTSSSYQHHPTSPLRTATPSLLQHQNTIQYQPSSPPISSGTFYFGLNTSLSDSNVLDAANTVLNTATSKPTGGVTSAQQQQQQRDQLNTNAGSLSFEDILNVYYNNGNNTVRTPDAFDHSSASGIMNLQSIHISSSTGDSASSSPPSISSPHSLSSSDYHSHDEDEDSSTALKSKLPGGKYKRSRTSISRQNQQQQMQKNGSGHAVNRTQCSNCRTTTTPLWRRDPQGHPLCNACGLFLKLHGAVRPLSLKTDIIKKRNRSSTNSGSSAVSAGSGQNTNATGKPNSGKTSKVYTKQQQQQQQKQFSEAVGLKKDESRNLIDRRNTVHIAPYQHPTNVNSNRPIISARPTLMSKRQRRTSDMLPITTGSTLSSPPTPTAHLMPQHTMENMLSSSSTSSTSSTSFQPSFSTASTATTSPGAAFNPSIASTSATETASSLPTASATNAAVYAILESIGIHLDSLPVELLPLIASAANYHAANKQRLQEQEQQQQKVDMSAILNNVLFQQQQQQVASSLSNTSLLSQSHMIASPKQQQQLQQDYQQQKRTVYDSMDSQKAP